MKPSSQSAAGSRGGGCTLVIMAKAPKPGVVKTRLAQSLPLAAVVELYRCLLDDTMALARSLDDVDVAIMCPASDVEDLSRAVGDSIPVVAQSGDGLAAGLTSVFAHFTAAGRSRVVAFNSDSPHLPASVLKSAFQALGQSDVVVGPTHDGGYYLVGATASHPGLFAGDGLGTTNAYEALLGRVRALGLSVSLTDPFYDIDVADDLSRLAGELRSAPERAPRTAQWLMEWRKAMPPEQSGRRAMRITASHRLYGLAAIMLAALLACARIPGGVGAPPYLVTLAIAGIAYLLAIREFFSTPKFPRRVIVIGLAVAALWHIPFLLMAAGPDDDVHRYVWDGRLQRLGYNPYSVVPNDPAFAALHTAETRQLNNPDVPSPYPAGAQLFFRAVTAIHESAFAFKVAFVLCELAIVPLLLAELRRLGQGEHWVLAYAWNPLARHMRDSERSH